MTPCINCLIRRAGALLVVLFLVVSAVRCCADNYSDQGMVYISGTVTDIENQQVCDSFGCQMGSSWSLWMHFQAPDWNAPGSDYSLSTVLLNCFGGPPCIDGYGASSDFGWAPYGFDMLSVDILDGKVVDARAACGGYFIEWGQADLWSYGDAFSGVTTGYAAPTPDAATIVSLATGMMIVGKRLHVLRPKK